MAGASAGEDSRELHCSSESGYNHDWSQYLRVHETVPIWPEPQPRQLRLEPCFRLGESTKSWETKEKGWNIPHQVMQDYRITTFICNPSVGVFGVFWKSFKKQKKNKSSHKIPLQDSHICWRSLLHLQRIFLPYWQLWRRNGNMGWWEHWNVIQGKASFSCHSGIPAVLPSVNDQFNWLNHSSIHTAV